MLLPLRFPDAVAGAQAAAADGRAHRSVLASGLAIAISDAAAEDDPLIWVSRSFEQLTGYTAQEALGRNCRFLQGPDTDRRTVARLRAGLTARESISVTLLNYRHDGSAFYNHLVVSPVFDAEGTLTHHVSVQTDVTAQVLAAREREAARAELDRARQAQSVAEDAGRVGQFMLTMSEALTATTTIRQVAATVTDVLAPELGADQWWVAPGRREPHPSRVRLHGHDAGRPGPVVVTRRLGGGRTGRRGGPHAAGDVLPRSRRPAGRPPGRHRRMPRYRRSGRASPCP